MEGGAVVKKEWFTAAELAALRLPGMPKSKSAISDLIKQQRWRQRLTLAGDRLARRRKGRGGGWEYHHSLLPLGANRKLVADDLRTGAVQEEPRGSSEIWSWFERQPDSKKHTAQERLEALRAVRDLRRGGYLKNTAVNMVAGERKVSASTIWTWFNLIAGVSEVDWLPHLCPRHVGRTKAAACDPRAWDWYKGQYLRRRAPTHADTYARLEEVAGKNGWKIPSARTLRRRMDTEVDRVTQVVLREGSEAIKTLMPTQERDRSVFAAGEAVNGDGLKFDRLWVRWPDGEILNTSTGWFWQDVRTDRILAWRLDKTENTDVFRLATYDLTAVCAPKHVYVDNTTVAANKLMTAGSAGRHRFHNKPEDGVGVLLMLDMEPHFTNPDRETGNPGAKPIERAFGIGGIHEMVANNPRLNDRGFSKATAIDAEELRAVIAQEVVRFNARKKRRTQACGGVLSFDEAWQQSVAETPPRVLSERQRRLLLMSREVVTADSKSGTITLKAGSGPYGRKNRYWCEHCLNQAGMKLAVHFDPENLRGDVHVYALDGRYLFSAPALPSSAFNNTKDGRAWGKFKRRFVKASKHAADAEVRMDSLERAALYADATGQPPDTGAPAAEAPAVVEGHFRRVPDPERDAERSEAEGTEPAEVIYPSFTQPDDEPGHDEEWVNRAFSAGLKKLRAQRAMDD